MRLGFIGIGKITSSVIEGISKSSIKFNKIILSPRNRKNSNSIKKKYKKILIAKSNQDVIDKSDWVFWRLHPKLEK